MFNERLHLLTSDGPVTAVATHLATSSERPRAVPPLRGPQLLARVADDARRGSLDQLLGLHALAGHVGPGIFFANVDVDQLLREVNAAIYRGRILLLPGWSGPGDRASEPPQPPPSTPEGRLIARIMGDARERGFEGARYRLVANHDWHVEPEPGLVVVRRAEATRILERMRLHAPSLAEKDALGEALALLAEDRATGPRRGLLLLRAAAPAGSASRVAAPAVTPSQLAALARAARGQASAPPIAAPPLTLLPLEQRRYDLELEHRYHDDELLQGAPFEVELEDGTVLTGALSGGRASRKGLTKRPVRVRFGPDARAYERVDQAANPAFDAAGGSAAFKARLAALLEAA